MTLYHGKCPVDMTVREALAEIHSAQPFPIPTTAQQAEREERELIVAWLRNEAVPGYAMDLHDADELADAIERGEHRKDKS